MNRYTCEINIIKITIFAFLMQVLILSVIYHPALNSRMSVIKHLFYDIKRDEKQPWNVSMKWKAWHIVNDLLMHIIPKGKNVFIIINQNVIICSASETIFWLTSRIPFTATLPLPSTDFILSTTSFHNTVYTTIFSCQVHLLHVTWIRWAADYFFFLFADIFL